MIPLTLTKTEDVLIFQGRNSVLSEAFNEAYLSLENYQGDNQTILLIFDMQSVWNDDEATFYACLICLQTNLAVGAYNLYSQYEQTLPQ